MKKLPTILLALAILAACAPTENQPPIIREAWARPAPAGQNSAIYFTIDNLNPSNERLISASTDAARAIEIHETTMDDSGVMSMHPQHAVEIPADSQVVFKPGGLHVMLIELVKDLRVGDTLSLTLNFDNFDAVTVEVPVKEGP